MLNIFNVVCCFVLFVVLGFFSPQILCICEYPDIHYFLVSSHGYRWNTFMNSTFYLLVFFCCFTILFHIVKERRITEIKPSHVMLHFFILFSNTFLSWRSRENEKLCFIKISCVSCSYLLCAENSPLMLQAPMLYTEGFSFQQPILSSSYLFKLVWKNSPIMHMPAFPTHTAEG